VQSAPQAIPMGFEVTLPAPAPLLATVSSWVVNVNVAVIVTGDGVIMTVHVPVPLQPPPDHPANVEPVAGDAVSTTEVPFVKSSEQSAPQVMPAGADTMVPLPLPAFATVIAVVPRLNVAVTVSGAVIDTVHVPVPVQPPPLQPTNVEPGEALAVSVSAVL
jgi:hypothetical protein